MAVAASVATAAVVATPPKVTPVILASAASMADKLEPSNVHDESSEGLGSVLEVVAEPVPL